VNNCQFCGAKFSLPKGVIKNVNGRGKYCSMDCKEFAYALFFKWPKGRTTTDIIKKCEYCGERFKFPAYQQKVRKYCSSECGTKATYKPFHVSGKNHWNWKGGLALDAEGVRRSYKYKEWQRAVFDRDNHTCQECGRSDCELHAHHIFEFARYPEHRFEVWNGLTLCRDCHMKIHNLQAA